MLAIDEDEEQFMSSCSSGLMRESASFDMDLQQDIIPAMKVVSFG